LHIKDILLPPQHVTKAKNTDKNQEAEAEMPREAAGWFGLERLASHTDRCLYGTLLHIKRFFKVGVIMAYFTCYDCVKRATLAGRPCRIKHILNW
jgi:hypothetical protein